MSPELFKQRTKAYALKIMNFVDHLPVARATNVIAGQLLRCGTSVGANYWMELLERPLKKSSLAVAAVCDRRDFERISPANGAHRAPLQDFCRDFLKESGKVRATDVAELKRDGSEILAMVVASINTARARRNNPQSAIRNPQSK
jgi:hypothetical protein